LSSEICLRSKLQHSVVVFICREFVIKRHLVLTEFLFCWNGLPKNYWCDTFWCLNCNSVVVKFLTLCGGAHQTPSNDTVRWAELRAYLGRAIAQAVSRRLPTAAARVRAQVRSCGICGGQRGTGIGFLRVLRFPLPVLIPPTAPHSSFITRGWYNRPNSGRRTKWTQPDTTTRN
jgi:hypothetical protein